MPSLRIEFGGQVVTARLGDRPVRVGRDPACDLRIDAAGVSALHLSIEPLPGGGHKLTDENLGLPTQVNGQVVKRVSLKSGDRIEVGPARITYLLDGADPAAPAARATPSPAGAAPGASLAAPSSPRSAPRDAAEPPPTEPAESPHVRDAVSARRLRTALWVAAGFAVTALSVAALLRGQGDPDLELKASKRRLEDAAALAREDVDRALSRLDALAASAPPSVRAEAEREAAYHRKRIEQAAADAADLERRGGRLDTERAAAEIAALEAKYGPSIARRHAGLLASLTQARASWVEASLREAETASAAATAEGRFADALAPWDALVADAAASHDIRGRVDEGRAAVEAKAGEAFATLAAEAARVATASGPRAAADLLRSRVASFAGTPAGTALAVRAVEYDHEAAVVAAPATPVPGPTSPEANPVPAVAVAPADRARIEGLLADANAKAAGRRFGEALAALDEAAKVAPSSPEATRVAGRRADVDLARTGLALLGATIRSHPERFVEVEIAPKFLASLVDADEQFVTAAVRGGRTKVRWTTFDGARTSVLVEAAAVPWKDALPLAALLREAGAREAAEKVLLRAAEGGGDRAAVDVCLARWRGEPVPAGGYVAYAGRLVTPSERDRLDLEARVSAAIVRVGSRTPRERRAAYEEILAIGAPAREAAGRALRARREAATKEIASLPVFSAAKTRQRLVEELRARRTAALALVEDTVAYPYPYPPEGEHPGQKEVGRLVDLVREVWERPFDVLVAWDGPLEASLATVREVDAVLARVEEGYEPDFGPVKAAIAAAIDLAGQVADPWDEDALAYNDRVATTSTREERDNVRIVNAYRIMMGRGAVKIDERLVRAARGHSHEMRVKEYFAHESATPGLESPAKRAAREGYVGGVGENIAKGTPTGRSAFDGWFASSGHHRNMLGKGWTEMGAGRSGEILWTQLFGGLTGRALADLPSLPPPGPETAPEPDAGEPPPTPPPPGKKGGRG